MRPAYTAAVFVVLAILMIFFRFILGELVYVLRYAYMSSWLCFSRSSPRNTWVAECVPHGRLY